jgi:glyoxylase-like metal-dependent hydrolase (beta-lactamase superfamily II)
VKSIAKIVAAGLLILVIGLLVFLLPAHLQVREVSPDLPSDESLRELLRADNAPVRVSYISTSSQRYEGGLLGEDVSRVKAVGFTHLHIDHTQGLINFCDARGAGALSLQLDYQRELHNFNTEEGDDIVAQSCLRPLDITGAGLVGVDQFPGLAMYPLGGHTPGSTLFAVADGDRLLLFTGDITNSKSDLVNNKGKTVIYSYLLVPENTTRTAQLREWLRRLDNNDDMQVVVSHDIQDMAEILQPY